jgi:hypothetical protein
MIAKMIDVTTTPAITGIRAVSPALIKENILGK